MTDSDDSVSRFTNLYKNISRPEQRQSERRKTLLAEQKLFRQTELDNARPGLLELIEADAPPEPECPEGQQQRRYRPRAWVSKLYRGKLQQSEWMHEAPEDLADWFMVPCPVGRRCLLVIRRGLAVAYDKGGRSITKFRTRLSSGQRVTVLDCFLTKEKIFYAIDVLVYNEMDLIQCECQYRFLWLRTKIEEDELQTKFCSSHWRLGVLPYYGLRAPFQVSECLSQYPLFPGTSTKLDGLLFYHKESNYIYGQTPLVTWLFPFMVPDVLGEQFRSAMHQHYLTSVPANYCGQNFRAYMDAFDERMAKKRTGRNRGRVVSDMELGGEELEGGGADCAGWEQMEAATIAEEGASESYEDENWQRKEVDEMRRLEMEG